MLEAETILRSALERALIVEEVQNQNFELRRQIEICQEENKILEKTNRQKVLEVEKLSQTINELEEAILAGGAAANTVRDYKRQISELNVSTTYYSFSQASIQLSDLIFLFHFVGGEEDPRKGTIKGQGFSKPNSDCGG